VEVVRQELELLAAHEAEILELMAQENLSAVEREEAIDLLEASLPFNCEHVVPQSWFDKAQPMRADLHHLFTCEPDCNSFRSNIPYFDFDPLEEAVRTDCGQRVEDKFEPEFGHGIVARATLYFLLRYPGMMGDTSKEMRKSRLAVLKRWHKANPVTRYELHRNAEIFAVQGNRNPLIDFPKLIDDIDFTLGFAD
jgi:endonuclease G